MLITIYDFVINKAWNIIWLFLLLLIGRTILTAIVNRLKKLMPVATDKNRSMKEKRARTLSKTIINLGNIIIYGIVFFTILTILGIDIKPIITGVGVAGLILGFGAQSLIKDFVSGLFILAENQYNIGDRVIIGGLEGRVLKVTLRSTILQDDIGQIIYVPNGSITSVVNGSQKS